MMIIYRPGSIAQHTLIISHGKGKVKGGDGTHTGFIPTYGNPFRFRELSANEVSKTCGSCVKAVFVVKTGDAVGRNMEPAIPVFLQSGMRSRFFVRSF